MGKVKVQGKIMDVRASNAGRADQDMLYTPTNGMLYDKQKFIDIQLFHKGVGELGENIKMINQGLRGEIDEFGYGQRITQPFIAQSLMDRQKQIETQKEIETDMITQGKINFLRQQGLLRDEERLGTFLPSARNGMRREILPAQREDVEGMRMPFDDRIRQLRRARERAGELPLRPSEQQRLTQEERIRRMAGEMEGIPRIRREETQEMLTERQRREHIVRELPEFFGDEDTPPDSLSMSSTVRPLPWGETVSGKASSSSDTPRSSHSGSIAISSASQERHITRDASDPFGFN